MLVDKPAGVSSHDVVDVARRALGERRIGHAGTLDPFATGLLVLLAGRATRLLPHLPGEPKVYDATVSFGAETTTEDLHGDVTTRAEAPTRDALLAALPKLTGAIDQVPPAYSAKRVDGKRAYERARAGEEVELKPSRIVVHRWEVLELDPGGEGGDRVASARLRVTCGGGTYVRSLARDLARACGSAAHLTALRRVSSGPFRVADAVSYDSLRDGSATLRPALDALPGFARQPLVADDVAKVVRGIDVAADVPGSWAALTDAANGALVALAERRPSERGERWQPRVVMREVH